MADRHADTATPDAGATGGLVGPWHLDPAVALRPEPFGALAYHYDSRRLTFLRSQVLVDLVRTLADYPSVDLALIAVVPEGRRSSHRRALDALATSGFIRPGAAPARPADTSRTEQST